MTTILIFIVVLVALILVHEFGHFLVAKAFRIRVDEFGIGFPPKLAGVKRGETEYTINALPLGGFVRIFGENPTEVGENDPDRDRSFIAKVWWKQALVLVAGVVGNVIFAWLLFAIGFMFGLPVAVTDSNRELVTDTKVLVTQVISESPAEEAGIRAGDAITRLSYSGGELDVISPEDVSQFIASYGHEMIAISYERGGELTTERIIPRIGIHEGNEAPLIGVSMAEVGIQQLSFFGALTHSIGFTLDVLITITGAIIAFIASALLLQADLAQVAGPVGIASLVGDATAQGSVYLLSFTAIISLHLAVINLLPFPALDGGRLLFIFIESIFRIQIKPSIGQAINALGFVLLILLMVFVTVGDISRLIN